MIVSIFLLSFVSVLAGILTAFIHFSIGGPYVAQVGENEFVSLSSTRRIFSSYGAYVARGMDGHMKTQKPSIWQPLGICTVCMGAWVGIFTLILSAFLLNIDLEALFFAPFFVALSAITAKKAQID